MSIADKITQLTNIRAAIRTALQSKGVSASAHDFADFANDILAIPTAGNIQSSKRVSAKVTGPTYVTPDTGYDGLAQVIVNMITRQAKTVTPSAADQTVSPDSGYQGLSEVTVEGDADLVPGNIKNGVDIFGITGTYSGGTPSLQSKSVNPSTSQQVVTPDSGYDGLSQVTVAAARLQTRTVTPTAADQQIEKTSTSYYGLLRVNINGDENLVASNIKKDVSIFGVTGTYEGSGEAVNASLIEATCSSNIDSVTATVNGHTYTATLTNGVAYVSIPETDTTVARTCTLRAYSNGTQVTTTTVSMTRGIGYYTAQLSTSAWLYRNNTWTGIQSHEWVRLAPSSYAGTINVTEGSNGITLALSASTGGGTRYAWEYISPKLSNRGYSQLEIVVASIATSDVITAYCGSSLSSEGSPGRALSVGTNLIPITTDANGEFYLEFYMNDWSTRTPNTAVISSMRFV